MHSSSARLCGATDHWWLAARRSDLRLLKAASPGPMKALATEFRGEDAAHTLSTGLSTHDIHSTGFRFPIPAAVVAVIAFGHVVTALFVYGLHLCGG